MKKDKKYVIDVYSSKELDRVCSSSMSYEEKIKEIEAQKKQLLELAKYYMEAENRLSDGGYNKEMYKRMVADYLKVCGELFVSNYIGNFVLSYARECGDNSYLKEPLWWIFLATTMMGFYLSVSNIDEIRKYDHSLGLSTRRLKVH